MFDFPSSFCPTKMFSAFTGDLNAAIDRKFWIDTAVIGMARASDAANAIVTQNEHRVHFDGLMGARVVANPHPGVRDGNRCAGSCAVIANIGRRLEGRCTMCGKPPHTIPTLA
jgi:hypothetical protein